MMKNNSVVEIYTDGACSGNPGPGGWAAILVAKGKEKEIAGSAELTTNNRMEMTAAIEALKQLRVACYVRIYSDSAYLVNAFLQGWLSSWKQNGWKNSTKQPVSNKELWQKLDELTTIHKVEWIKVKGHADHAYNNRCDALAVAQVNKVRSGEEEE